MKKYLIAFLILIPFPVFAEVPQGVMGFQDGKLYNTVDSSLAYICFLNGECFDKEMKFAFNRRTIQFHQPVAETPTKISLLENTPAPNTTSSIPFNSVNPISNNSIPTTTVPVIKLLSDSIYCFLGIGQPNSISDNFFGPIINYYSTGAGYSAEITCRKGNNNESIGMLNVVSVDLLITNDLLNNENDAPISFSQIRINNGVTNQVYSDITLNSGEFYTKTIPLITPYLYITTTRKNWNTVNGYTIKVGNLVIKDENDNLITTHLLN